MHDHKDISRREHKCYNRQMFTTDDKIATNEFNKLANKHYNVIVTKQFTALNRSLQ